MSLPDTDQVREFIHEALDQITMAQSELGTGEVRDEWSRTTTLWKIQDALSSLECALDKIENLDFT